MTYLDKATKLLAKFNESEGSTILDSSFYGKAISKIYGADVGKTYLHSGTPNGNAKISTTQYKFGASSAYFDGSGDYVSFSAWNSMTFDTEDFTIDMWVNPDTGIFSGGGYNYDRTLFGCPTGPVNDYFLYLENDTGQLLIYDWNGTQIGTGSSVIATNTWTHIAFVRVSGVGYLYINGIQKATGSFGTSYTAGIKTIGGSSSVSTRSFKGYIDELRVSKIARWTTEFTPPTEPHTVDQYTPLLMHFEGVNNSTTFINDASAPTSHFGTLNALGLDGDASVTLLDSDDWYLGTGNYTIDFWVCRFDSSTRKLLQQYSSSTNALILSITSDSIFASFYISTGVVYYTVNIIIPINTWTHIALVREGLTTTKWYVNGTQIGDTFVTNYNLPDAGSGLQIGGWSGESTGFWGYISNFRWTKGIARWTANFTPESDFYSATRSPYGYVNPLTGNDLDCGTSWATAWKSIKYGAEAIATVPGNIIKIAKSPDPVSIGNATWTNKSPTVTLASALTQNIDLCDSGWTASTYITLTYDTIVKKQGIAALTIVVESSFTTGKICYKTLATPLDLSMYTAISFWAKTTIASSYGLKICLCSDTIGDTPVDTLYVQPADMCASTSWTVRRLSKESALGSSIQSIAIYVEVDPGSSTFYFDNIMACNDFSLYSLITKKDTNNVYEAWYSIQSIVGIIIILNTDPSIGITPINGYYGTGGTVDTYRREPFYLTNNDAFHPQDSGTEGSLIQFSGGWDTSLDEITGQTYIDGLTSNTSGIVYNTQNYTEMLRINPVRGWCGFSITGHYNKIDFESIVRGYACALKVVGNFNSCVGKFINSSPNESNSVDVTGNCNIIDVDQIINGGTGISAQGYKNKFIFDLIANMINTTYSGMVIRGFGNSFYGGIIKDNLTNGIVLYDTIRNNYFYDILFQSNAIDVKYAATASGVQHFINCTRESVTPFSDLGIPYESECRFIKNEGDVNDNLVYKYGGYIQSQTSIKYGTGIGWKISPTSLTKVIEQIPLILSVVKAAVSANAQVTVTAWMLRTDLGIVGKLVCPENRVIGIENDVSSSLTDIGGWQQLTIQFTPTSTGVVEIQAQAYGGTDCSVYIDEINISQG